MSWWRGRTHKLLSAPSVHILMPLKGVTTNSIQRKASKLVPATWTSGPDRPAGSVSSQRWETACFPPDGPLLCFGLEYADRVCFVLLNRVHGLQKPPAKPRWQRLQPSLTPARCSIAAIRIRTSTIHYYLFFGVFFFLQNPAETILLLL